jgi:carbonic anhydrase
MSIDRRMLLRGALACACCAKAGLAMASDAPAHGGAAVAHWSYEGDGNPEKWGELQSDFKMCQLGLEQTPIDLGNGIKGDVGSVDYDYKPLPLRIINNGHTIQFNADPGSACVIGGARYELLQFHMHHPSEHLLAGKGFDLECHFVHKSGAGALAVTGVFIRRVQRTQPEGILRADASQGGAEVKLQARSISQAFCRGSGYFRYMGSDDASLFGRLDGTV